MFFTFLLLGLFLPGFLSISTSALVVLICCVVLLAGRGDRWLPVAVVIFCLQWARLSEQATHLWPQDFAARAMVDISLLQVRYQRGQGMGLGQIHSGPFAGRVQVSFDAKHWQPILGERWRVPVKLKGIPVTPGARDMAFDQMARGIRGRARVQRGHHELVRPAGMADRIRHGWRQQLATTTPASQWLGRGMLLGDKPDWGQDRQASLEQSGLGHLFSPSGLHLGMAVALWTVFLPSRGRLLGGTIQRGPALAFGAIGVFALLPTRLPITRALIGFLLVFANRFQRRWDWAVLYAVTLGLCLIIWPAASGQSSTALSFGAVGWILVTTRAPVARWRQWLAVTLGLSAMSVLMGLGAGVFSAVSNAIWVPLVGTLGASSLVLGLSLDFWTPWGLFCQALMAYLEWLPHYSLSFWQGGVLAVLAMGLVWPVSLVLLLACALGLLRDPPTGLWFYSVGAGQAARLSWGGQHWLLDVAPAQPGQIGAIGWEALPSLRRQGVRRLDRVLVSHGDSDHAGGLPAVQSRFVIDQLLSGEPIRTGGAACYAGQSWKIDQIRILVHWGGPPLTKNEASCVVEIQTPTGSVWIFGDSPKQQQWRMAMARGGIDRARVVVAGHHGARDGFSTDLAAAQGPQHVVFSSAKLGRWLHPHPSVEQGWQKTGAQTWKLGDSGTLWIDLADLAKPPEQIHIESYWTRVARKSPQAD